MIRVITAEDINVVIKFCSSADLDLFLDSWLDKPDYTQSNLALSRERCVKFGLWINRAVGIATYRKYGTLRNFLIEDIRFITNSKMPTKEQLEDSKQALLYLLTEAKDDYLCESVAKIIRRTK
jgi:hypothetical protein